MADSFTERYQTSMREDGFHTSMSQFAITEWEVCTPGRSYAWSLTSSPKHVFPPCRSRLDANVSDFRSTLQIYMKFMNWRFETLLESYEAMIGPKGEGVASFSSCIPCCFNTFHITLSFWPVLGFSFRLIIHSFRPPRSFIFVFLGFYEAWGAGEPFPIIFDDGTPLQAKQKERKMDSRPLLSIFIHVNDFARCHPSIWW